MEVNSGNKSVTTYTLVYHEIFALRVATYIDMYYEPLTWSSSSSSDILHGYLLYGHSLHALKQAIVINKSRPTVGVR